MPLLAQLPLYLLYAVVGTVAAALAKRSFERLGRQEWQIGFTLFCCAGGLLLVNFALLVNFLDEGAVSVVAPIAIGVNLLVAAIIARVFFKERLDRHRVLGMLAIAVGVALVSWG
ncbi:EamA family transporter [Lacibacterium aquatile]|uniref:EamA family transporter n=1 Tax=Lacibacterium aquatile TaxID=1168082 RepID=A0ABW5DQE9_9PROT